MKNFARNATLLAALSTAAMVVEPVVASAQIPPPPPLYEAPPAPPSPPTGVQPQMPPPAPPNDNAWAYQRNYQDYRDQYAQWAGRNCTTQHSNNIAAGAIVGGVAGALLAGSIAGWAARGAWILFGGSLGLATGATIGATSSAPGCPSGYAVRTGAPPFYYGGPVYPAYQQPPAYASTPYYRAAPYGGWTWDGYRWVRRPYYPYRPPAPYPYGPY